MGIGWLLVIAPYQVAGRSNFRNLAHGPERTKGSIDNNG